MTVQATCTENDCPIKLTGLGRCLNGFDPSNSCPHYVEEPGIDDSDITATDVSDSSAIESNLDQTDSSQDVSVQPIDEDGNILVNSNQSEIMLPLYSGRLLTDAEATRIAAKNRSRVIALAGLEDSGKTTLLAEILHSFQEEPTNEIMFAGCRTFLAFEERCFKSRLASDNNTPQTERTPGGFTTAYLHLKLILNDGVSSPIDLLIADIPGEDCKEAARSNDATQNLKVLNRADYLVLLFDGKKLSNLEQRESAIAVPIQLLRRFIENGLVQGHDNVSIVFTKWDYIVQSDPETNSLECVEQIKQLVKKQFAGKIGRINVHQLASWSCCSNDVPHRFGINGLIKEWVEPVLPIEFPTAEPQFAPEDRFMSRYIGREK